MKFVGKAIRDYMLTSVLTVPVVSIGIATFGVLDQYEELNNGIKPVVLIFEKF